MKTLREQLFFNRTTTFRFGVYRVPCNKSGENLILPGTSSCLDETLKLLEGTLEEFDAELRNSRRFVVGWQLYAHVVAISAPSGWPWQIGWKFQVSNCFEEGWDDGKL